MIYSTVESTSTVVVPHTAVVYYNPDKIRLAVNLIVIYNWIKN